MVWTGYRFKIAADILMAFVGEFFVVEQTTESRYNVVQIEVSIVTTRHDNEKPDRDSF